MPLEIPYTFIAGTKAKANEVNANFLAIKNMVDTLEVTQTEQGNDITALLAQKADLNGNQGELFRVADAESDYDAVNKKSVEELTYNSRGLFWGLELTKVGDDTISVSPGGCYDSTYEYMIKNEITITRQQSGLGADTTYYVYICAQENEENVVVFSLSGTTPEVPVGYSYYRRLGYFETNDEGNIEEVTSESSSSIVKDKSFMKYSCGFIGPLIYSKSGNQEEDKSFDVNTWLSIDAVGGDMFVNVYINDVLVFKEHSGTGRSTGGGSMIPLLAGQEFRTQGRGVSIKVFEMIYEKDDPE